MPLKILPPDDEHVLDLSAVHLARLNPEPRHDYKGYLGGSPRARFREGWRFPLIETCPEPGYNDVTFVWRREPEAPPPREVAVAGTFQPLYERLPMREIPGTIYWYAGVRIPHGEVHRYCYYVDNQRVLDPVNPQQDASDAGTPWSRFFTDYCTRPLVFEPWERTLLDRLTAHILPFRTQAAEEYLRREGGIRPRHIQHLDEAVGVTNYIDKLLAREEAHNLVDYRICLRVMDQLIRRREPYLEPAQARKEVFEQLYAEMGANSVPGWPYGVYGNPRYFLEMLRRHALLGAFTHPRYGGNAGAVGWRFLAESFLGAGGKNVFRWELAIEPPLGASTDYRG